MEIEYFRLRLIPATVLAFLGCAMILGCASNIYEMIYVYRFGGRHRDSILSMFNVKLIALHGCAGISLAVAAFFAVKPRWPLTAAAIGACIACLYVADRVLNHWS